MTHNKMKSPCIRGLKRFDEVGCPEVGWNELRQTGCTLWNDYPVIDKANPTKTKLIWMCNDVWECHFKMNQLKLLEGIQIAIESFRNGVVEEVDGKVTPKPSAVLSQLIGSVKLHKKILDGR